MKTRRYPIFLLGLLLAIAGLALAQGLIVEAADIIVIHGRVYTLNPKQPWAQAVAIRKGMIVAVGEDATIEKRRGMGTKVVNAGGRIILPGFTDCHVHFFRGSLGLNRVQLDGAKDAGLRGATSG